MMVATVDVEPRSLGGQFGYDAEVASKCRRGVVNLVIQVGGFWV